MHDYRNHGNAGNRTWRGERRSGGATFVVVMQAANVWDLNNRTEGRWLRRPRDGSIFVQREVSSPFMIINEVALQVAAQGALVPDDDVIEALAPEGADHAFNERILPGRTRRRHHFFDAQSLRGTPRIRSIDPIAIPDDESWRSVPRPRFAELLRGPRSARMRRDIQVDDAASVVREHHEHKQDAEGGGGDREEVDRGELGYVIGEKGAPWLRGGTTAPSQVLRHSGLRHLEAELLQLAVDPWGSPERIRLVHLADQGAEVRCQRRATDAAGSRLPAPTGRECAPMPMHDGGGRHDLNRLPPVRPHAR
jgi:hypothetical protein